MFSDFRFGWRVLWSRPTFTLVAAFSLALGIGANSAIFSLVDAFWFRPMDVPRSGEIVRLFSTTDQDKEGAFSYAEFEEIQRQSRTLRDVVAVGGRGATVGDSDNHELASLNLVSPNFFTALGVRPALGRLFTPEDEAKNHGEVLVVLGNSFWKRHFGGDSSVVGKQMLVERMVKTPVTIIGVLPPTFREVHTGGDRDMWFAPSSWRRIGDPGELKTRGNRWFRVLGRLGPRVDTTAANAEVHTIADRLAVSWPESNKGRGAILVSDLKYRFDQAGTDLLAPLLLIVLLVVLISSVNVANLLLSRSASRGAEMAVRLAMGASRSRLVRQLMAENILLGVAGFLLSLIVGGALIRLLPVLIIAPPGLHESMQFEFDSRVVWFSMAISAITIGFFGLAPAWKTTRPDLVPALKGEGAFAASSHRWPLRNILAVAQIAVSLTLLASTGVLVRSFANTRSNELGFGRKQLLLVWMAASDAKPELYRRIVTRFEGLPGVRSVAVAVRAPLSLSSQGMFRRVTFPNRVDLASQPPFEIKYNSVSPNFLSTMGTPMLRGRGFDARDETGGLNSVLINERMAKRFWPSEDALGKTLRMGKEYTVIGVVKNAPINDIAETPEPYLYLPYWANFEEEATFLIETTSDAAGLAQASRLALKDVERSLYPLTITTENELIRYSAMRFQMSAEVVGCLGVLGLLLTAVGLYGVVSYGIGQRTREIGIRMALGADRADTLALVLRDVARLGLAGAIIGVPLALVATRLFASLLFGVDPWHIPAFAASALVLGVVLLLAGLLPARRAAAIEPWRALRVS